MVHTPYSKFEHPYALNSQAGSEGGACSVAGEAEQCEERSGGGGERSLVLHNREAGPWWWRRRPGHRGLPHPVCRLLLPPAPAGWPGPRMRIALPSFRCSAAAAARPRTSP